MEQNTQENTASEDGEYLLHQAVFSNNIRKLSALIRTKDVSERDKHGKFSMYRCFF